MACVSGASAGARTGQVRTEDIALVEAIGGDDCVVLASSRGPACVAALCAAASSEQRAARGEGDALVTRRLGWPAASMVMRRRRRLLVEGCGCLRRGGSQSSPVCGTAISAVLWQRAGWRWAASGRAGGGQAMGDGRWAREQAERLCSGYRAGLGRRRHRYAGC